MPRKPNQRIESPATLGRKCWAFAYLARIWTTLKPSLIHRLQGTGLSLSKYIAAYDEAVRLTMGLCPRVNANCFLNKTYDQHRNGTCPVQNQQFFVGYQWENGLRSFSIPFPFPSYHWTEEFFAAVHVSVDTALNQII